MTRTFAVDGDCYLPAGPQIISWDQSAQRAGGVASGTPRLVADLLDKVFVGSAMNLVMQALSARPASRDELRQLRELLDGMKEIGHERARGRWLGAGALRLAGRAGGGRRRRGVAMDARRLRVGRYALSAGALFAMMLLPVATAWRLARADARPAIEALDIAPAVAVVEPRSALTPPVARTTLDRRPDHPQSADPAGREAAWTASSRVPPMALGARVAVALARLSTHCCRGVCPRRRMRRAIIALGIAHYLRDRFEAGRVQLRQRSWGDPLSGRATVGEWVAAFKAKRVQIIDRR